MRRKRRRPKSWLARLFSFGARGTDGPDARAESAPSEPPASSQRPSAKQRLDPAQVLAMAKALDPAKKLPPKAADPEPAPAPASSSPPAKDEGPSKPLSIAKARVPAKAPSARKPSAPAAAPASAAVPSTTSESDASASPSTDVPDAGDKPAGEGKVPDWLVAYWRRMGGGSLMVSLGVHLVLLIVASFIVSSVVREPAIDFLAGGGSKAGEAASNELAQQMQKKRRLPLTKAPPLQRVVANTVSAIPLPELPIDIIPLPDMSSPLGGTMGSGGFGSSGAGGGFGNGMGIGGMSGRAFKPITMFGKNLNARSIAVILDVSGSMTPHLSKVIAELDRVARGSPVILYVGCGVAKPAGGIRLNDDTTDTRRIAAFKPFWESHHGPEQDVFNIMSKRPYTYFIKDQGIQYAWISLLADEVRRAEALYWFSDFQDQVDDSQMESVLTNLKRRKQKLFIHASDMGQSFEAIRDKICIPSGGSVIQTGG